MSNGNLREGGGLRAWGVDDALLGFATWSLVWWKGLFELEWERREWDFIWARGGRVEGFWKCRWAACWLHHLSIQRGFNDWKLA